MMGDKASHVDISLYYELHFVVGMTLGKNIFLPSTCS